MKAKVKTQIVIHAEPAKVFNCLSHTQYHHLWNPHLQSIEPIIQLKLHSHYQTTSSIVGVRTKGENRVTKFVQNQELEVENKSGMLQYRVNYRLVAAGENVKLVCTTVVSSEGKAFAFAKPMMEHLARRELNADLKALKAAVEKGLK